MAFRRGLIAGLSLVLELCAASGSGLGAQAPGNAATDAPRTDARLTVADVERVTGMAGLQVIGAGAVFGAGPGLNFAGPDKRMVLMVNFGTAELYRRARAQTEMKMGNMAAIVESRL